jgi:two-component system sporulation sensor kinase B
LKFLKDFRRLVQILFNNTLINFLFPPLQSGAPLSPDQLQKLGTPFFSDKSTGTGLGMLIVTNMLKLSGGKMKVTSEPGKGTTFAFEFLLSQVQPSSPPS